MDTIVTITAIIGVVVVATVLSELSLAVWVVQCWATLSGAGRLELLLAASAARFWVVTSTNNIRDHVTDAEGPLFDLMATVPSVRLT